jgi:hypothetical protein
MELVFGDSMKWEELRNLCEEWLLNSKAELENRFE